MHAVNCGAVPCLAFFHHASDGVIRLEDFFLGDGHCRGLPESYAVFDNTLGDLSDIVGVTVGNVKSDITVDMHVDKSGCDIAALGVDHLGACGNCAFVENIGDLVVIGKSLAANDLVLEDQFTVFDVLHN